MLNQRTGWLSSRVAPRLACGERGEGPAMTSALGQHARGSAVTAWQSARTPVMSGSSAKWGAHEGGHHGLPQLAAPRTAHS